MILYQVQARVWSGNLVIQPRRTQKTWRSETATKAKYPGGVQASNRGWSEAEPPEIAHLSTRPGGAQVGHPQTSMRIFSFQKDLPNCSPPPHPGRLFERNARGLRRFCEIGVRKLQFFALFALFASFAVSSLGCDSATSSFFRDMEPTTNSSPRSSTHPFPRGSCRAGRGWFRRRVARYDETGGKTCRRWTEAPLRGVRP